MTRDELKTLIRDLATEGRAIQSRIGETQGLERHALWNEKRRVGRRARAALLAYAYVRAVPYRRVEPKCKPGHALYDGSLANLWSRELALPVVRRTYTPPPSALRALLLRLTGRLGMAPVEAPAPETIWHQGRIADWLAAPARKGASAA